MYSMMDKQGSGWGVTLTGGNIILYDGNTYASRTPAFNEAYSVPAAVGISGFSEIDFARVTGLPQATATIVTSGDGSTHTIVVNAQGVVATH
jgi:hypothetical protein